MISGPTPSPGMRVTGTLSLGPADGGDRCTGVGGDKCRDDDWIAWTPGTRHLHTVLASMVMVDDTSEILNA